MNVEQLMTKDVRTCRPEESLNEAARIMWEMDVGCVPVIAADGTGRVLGIVTDRDICMAAYTQGRPLFEIPVSEAMSKSVVACLPDETIAKAAERMRERHVRRLPVIDDAEQLLGLISLTDIAREAAQERRKKTKAVSDADIGKTLAAICEPRLPASLA
jgi:CBS domain-containing protein